MLLVGSSHLKERQRQIGESGVSAHVPVSSPPDTLELSRSPHLDNDDDGDN